MVMFTKDNLPRKWETSVKKSENWNRVCLDNFGTLLLLYHFVSKYKVKNVQMNSPHSLLFLRNINFIQAFLFNLLTILLLYNKSAILISFS